MKKNKKTNEIFRLESSRVNTGYLLEEKLLVEIKVTKVFPFKFKRPGCKFRTKKDVYRIDRKENFPAELLFQDSKQ